MNLVLMISNEVRELKELREDYMIADLMKKYTFVINQEQRDKKETVVKLKEELFSLKRLVLAYLKRQKKSDESTDKQIDILIDTYLQYGNLKEKEKDLFLSYKPHQKEKVFV